MIAKRENEETVREFKGKIKGYGKGTLHVTTQRLCFESEKYGMCFDLDYDHLFSWQGTKKGLVVKWQELPETRTVLLPEDPIHKVEIQLDHNKHKKNEMDVYGVAHYTLFYAYTDAVNCQGKRGYGWHMNEKNELVHLFDYNRNHIKTEQDLYRVEFVRNVVEQSYVEQGTGDKQLDRMMYEHNEIWNAWKKNGRFGDQDGHTSKEMEATIDDDVEEGLNDSIENGKRFIAETGAKIAALEKEGNTAELEKIIESNWTDKPDTLGIAYPREAYTPTGTIRTQLEHQKKCLTADTRCKELISGMKFDYFVQFCTYQRRLHNELMVKIYAGEDISTVSPQIEKAPDHMIAAKQRIEERRKKMQE